MTAVRCHKYISQSNLKVICDDFVTHLICKEYKAMESMIRIMVAAANQDDLTIKARQPYWWQEPGRPPLCIHYYI